MTSPAKSSLYRSPAVSPPYRKVGCFGSHETEMNEPANAPQMHPIAPKFYCFIHARAQAIPGDWPNLSTLSGGGRGVRGISLVPGRRILDRPRRRRSRTAHAICVGRE